jgi:hypothetical protein
MSWSWWRSNPGLERTWCRAATARSPPDWRRCAGRIRCASALEASAFAGPEPAGSATQLIVRHLAGRSLVVVLDNCEHVIGEAAALAGTPVGAVPGLRLIATSREALGIGGEVLVPVGGPAAARLRALAP